MTGYIKVPITDQTVVDREHKARLGPIILAMPEGEALCHDALSLTSSTASDDDGMFIVITTIAVFDGRHLGALVRLTPTQARNFAASLIVGANEIDGGARG